MGLGSIFGKPKKPKASAAEVANAEIGKKQWDYYKSAGFTGLEQDMLEESGRDFTELQQGRGNADVFQAQAGGGIRPVQQVLANGGNASSPLAKLNTATAEAGASADVGASTAAQNNQNKRGASAAGFGVGIVGNAISGNSQLSSMKTNEAIARMNRKSSEAMARFSALAGVGGATAGAYQQQQQSEKFDNQLAAMNDSYYKKARWASNTPIVST